MAEDSKQTLSLVQESLTGINRMQPRMETDTFTVNGSVSGINKMAPTKPAPTTTTNETKDK